ncbi:unnamed protein product, partial [Tenebrio molitor]
DYDLRNTFSIEKSLLLFAGFYPRRDTKNSSLHTFSALMHLCFAYTQLLSMIIQLIIDKNDVSKLSETLLFFMTHVTFLYKLTNFIYHRNNLLDIEDSLTLPIFYGFPFDRLGQLKSEIESCKTIGKIFRITCVVALALYGLVPYLDKGKSMTLPLPGWIPYNVRKCYYPTYMFQMISVCITAYVNSTIDILTWMLITVASAEFEILKGNLEKIDYRSNGVKEHSKIIENNFNKCVKHHKAVVNFVYKIEYTFSDGIFLQFFSSVIVICVTGFLMIIVPIPSMQFGFLAMYFLCMMCQVAMYCWYGHIVMTTSDNIGHSFYMSNWYESDITIRKNLSIFLEKTKKPVTLTAGKFITLSLTTFTRVRNQ